MPDERQEPEKPPEERQLQGEPDTSGPDAPPSDEDAKFRSAQVQAVRRGEEPPHRTEAGHLTRHGMVSAIRNGGVVMVHAPRPGGGLDTKVIERVDDLPSEADLAKGDRVRSEAVRKQLLAQRAQLDAEIAKVSADEPHGADEPERAEQSGSQSESQSGSQPEQSDDTRRSRRRRPTE